MCEHDIKYRIYLDPCDECKEKGDAENCDLVAYGICCICGEVAK